MTSVREGANSASAADALRRLRSPMVPAGLLILLFVLLGFFVATQPNEYGRTFDEELQDEYGVAVLAWYTSAGADQSFLAFPPILHMPQHGPLFETVVAAVQSVTGERWTTRAVVTAVAALLGVLAIALCGYELGGWWMAFLSAAGLALYPRYSGAMFNNPKDVPFAAAMVFVLWLTLRLIRRWPRPRAFLLDGALVGLAIGAATSIRVVAVVWYPLLGLVLLGYWLRHGAAHRAGGAWRAALAKQALCAASVVSVSVLAMCAFWPYVFLDPLPHFIESVRAMTNYPWVGMVPLGDQSYSSLDLPRRYTIEWLVIGSPPLVVVFGIVGGLLALVQLLRIRTGDARIVLVGLCFGVPLVAFIVLRSTMYNGLRHFLFVVPPLILLAAYGLSRSMSFLMARRQRVLAGALVGLALLAQVELTAAITRIHPYEYSYFSPVVGGFRGAVGRYELDYWGTCNKAAAQWLASNHGAHLVAAPGQPLTVRSSGLAFLVTTYLPPDVFRHDYQIEHPDFYIRSMHYVADEFPSYTTIHEVLVEGHAICTVKRRPG
ncbi:hypothetical protein WEI85_40100 [Actinomycetes bacterium KLBMP 9797]